jgi:hypothetical protein
MNERIDELMIQAGARFEFLHGVHYDDFQYRKFAELLIRECADISQSIGEHGYIASKEMLEHFGVEE